MSLVMGIVGSDKLAIYSWDIAFSLIVLFILLLSQVIWKQSLIERSIAFGLLSLQSLFSLMNLSIIANTILLGLSLFALYQIKSCFKEVFKITIVLLMLFINAIVNILAVLIDHSTVWMISSLLVAVVLLTTYVTLQERLIKLLMNSYFASVTDPLTSLYNKRYYQKQLQNELTKNTESVYAIFCDIDNFKQINDTYGHEKADEILKSVANIVQGEVDAYGIAARYGGEEIVAFVCLGTEDSRIKTITERIRERVVNETIVTLSIGYSKGEKDLSSNQLIEMADKAMYFSKSNGKNRVTSFDSLQN